MAMSDPLTDPTGNRTADAAAPGGANQSGRHRGTTSPADTPAADPNPHGRHRRAEQPPAEQR